MQEDRKLFERLRLGGFFFFTLALTATWIFFLGSMSAGVWPAPAILILLMLVPLPLVVLAVTLLNIAHLMRRAHWIAMALTFVALVPLYAQPWNPNRPFVSELRFVPSGSSEENDR